MREKFNRLSPRMLLLIDYLYITLGSFIVAVSVTWIFVPSKTVTGGVTGIALLLYHLFDTPISLSSLAINIPLFWAGYRYLGGREFALKTLYGILALTLFLKLTESFSNYPLTENLLLASIYGGLMLGTGLGVVFRGRATTGGTDLAARLMQNLTGVSAGKMLLVIDGCIIASAGIIFGIERVLYALISLYITAKAIDLVQQGGSFAKVAYIITDRTHAVRDAILYSLNRGCTEIPSYGGFTGAPRATLMVVVYRSEVSRLKELVRQHDASAFVIVSDAQEVLGQGFSTARDPKEIDPRPVPTNE